MATRTPRRLLVAGALSLLTATLVGGAAFAVIEGASYLDGVWLAFAVVSTTGFGEGPATLGGQVTAVLLFAWAAASYLLLLVGGSAYGHLLADERRRLHMLSRHDVRQLARGLHRN